MDAGFLVEAKASALAVPADELVARARALAPMFRADAEQTERNRRVSPEAIEALREAELFKLMQPRRFGGFEHGFDVLIDINFELGQACASAAWCGSLGMVHQWFVSLFPLEAQQEVWSSPGTIIAGSYIPSGKAEPAKGGYRISGKWPFTSNCDNSDYFLLGAMFPSEAEAEKLEPGFVLIPKVEMTIIDDWFTVGLAGTGSKSVATPEPVFVPAHRRLLVADACSGSPPGLPVTGNSLYAIPFLSAVPVCLASPVLGMVQGAINDFLDWIGARTTLGSVVGGGARMAQFPHVQSRVAEASAAVDTAKLLIQRDVCEVQMLAKRGEPVPLDIRMRNRRDQAYATRLAMQAVNTLFDAVGAAGLSSSSSIQRAWRDVNSAARHASLNWDAVSTMYGQHLFGLPPVGQY